MKTTKMLFSMIIMVFAGQVVGYTGEDPAASAEHNRATDWVVDTHAGNAHGNWSYHLMTKADITTYGRADETYWTPVNYNSTKVDLGRTGGYRIWKPQPDNLTAGAWDYHITNLWNKDATTTLFTYMEAEMVAVFTVPETGDYNIVGDLLWSCEKATDPRAYVHIGTVKSGVYNNLWTSVQLRDADNASPYVNIDPASPVAVPGYTGNAALLGIALDAGDKLLISLQSGTSNYRKSNLHDTGVYIEYFSPPVVAENPSPSDGETRIEQNLAALAWQDSEAVSGESYDVYFAADGDALVKIGTVAEGIGSCPLTADLDTNMTYNWRVDTVQGTTIDTGYSWSFTTGGIAVNPAPADTASGIATLPTLAWEGDREGASYIEEYDVYLGETPGTMVIRGTTSETSYEITSELADSATYYWKVVAKHGGTEIVSYQPTWSFTTGKLLAYWTMDDVNDPNDAAASVNAGLPTMVVKSEETSGDPNQVAGIVGNAVQFNGDSCFVLAEDIGYWDNTNKGLTIALWGKWDADQDWAPIVTKSNEIVGKTWAIPRVNGGWDLHLYKTYFQPELILDGPDDHTAEIKGPGIYDDWHHLVVTYSPQGRQMWIDAVLVNEEDGVAPFNVGDAPVSVGGRVNASGVLEQGFIGILDEVYVYDRPLVEAQIVYLYENSPMSKFPDPADGENEVAFDTLLSWTPGADGLGIASQTLTYSTNSDLSDATVVSGLAADASSYDTGINLELGYKYFWKVESCDAAGDPIWEATVWSFTVMKLDADIVVNKIVGMSDLQALTADWLDDARSVPSEGVLPWTEDYTSNNMNDYLYAYGGVYAETWWEIGTPVADPNFAPALTASAEWQMGDLATHANRQIQCQATFSEPVDLTDVDKVTFWVRPVGIKDVDNNNPNGDGWFICWCFDAIGTFVTPTIRAIDPSDGEPINWTEASAANGDTGKWVKMEWDTSTLTNTWEGLAMWTKWVYGGNVGGYFEFADIELIYEGVVEPICWFGADFSEADINNDCDVNLLDFAELGLEWLLDANNY